MAQQRDSYQGLPTPFDNDNSNLEHAALIIFLRFLLQFIFYSIIFTFDFIDDNKVSFLLKPNTDVTKLWGN